MGRAAPTLDQPTISRRTVLRTGAVGAGAVALGGLGLDLTLATSASAASAASFVGTDPDLHLLRRATWGPTKESRAEIRKLGRTKWLEQQLHPNTIKDDACDKLLKQRYPGLEWNITQARAHLEDFSGDLMWDLGQAVLLRAAWSKRQLFEVMVDFWSNHLNVSNPFDSGWDNRHDYDRTVIRRHALGRFDDMLIASMQHPAMLYYLNNAESTKDDPNENYGREFLELHTVGVDGGYDEEDMRQSTLVLTGLTVDWETGLFHYEKDDHYTGKVKVMKWSAPNKHANDGLSLAKSYAKYLAHHPSTARRLATKLCERFVSDDPPKPLVDNLAHIYLANDTAIVPVLRALFTSRQFAQSKGKKVRRPMQQTIATIRILDTKPGNDPDDIQNLYWFVQGLGDAPLAWGPPNGYPDTADAWASAGGTLGRWNSTTALCSWDWPGLARPDLRKHLLPKKLPKSNGALVDTLSKRLVFRQLPPAHRTAVLHFFGSDPATEDNLNWRLSGLVSLILSSPYHVLR